MRNGNKNEWINTYQGAGIKMMPTLNTYKEIRNVAREMDLFELEMLYLSEFIFTRSKKED